MNANGSNSEHEAAKLRRLLPELADRDLPAGRHLILKEHLMSEIRLASGGRSVGQPAVRPPKRRRRARVVLAAVGACAMLAVVITGRLALTGRGGHTAPGSRGAAIQLLAKIAAVAGRQPVPVVRDSQFVYIKSEIAFLSTVVTIGPGGAGKFSSHLDKVHERQIWLPVADLCRVGLLRENGQSTVLQDHASPGMTCPNRGSLNEPSYRFLQSLPTSPRALIAMIYTRERGHGPTPDSEAFTTIGDLLNESIAPPAVSAALYRAAALIPGVTIVSDAVNAVGRHGVAVAFDYGGVRSEWIFDRHTLLLIGEREVSIKTGSVVGESAILVRAFVNRPGQLP